MSRLSEPGRGVSGTGHLWLRDDKGEKYHATECWCYDSPGRSPSRCGVSWDEHPTVNGESYCEPSSCPARSGRVLTATVGDLRAQVDRLPDIAEILVEMNDGSQFEVRQVRAIGTKTDDPGLILRVERVR